MKPDLAIMRARLSEATTAEIPHQDKGLSDYRFLTGEQYPEDVRQAREGNGQPCITVNVLPQSVRRVTDQIRSLNPAIRVKAGDNVATKDVADIFEGLIRDIEYRSDAPSIYEAAAESAAAASIGYWRIRTDYCDDASFDQHILIERIYNPFSVFFDPTAKHPTRKDARYCFVIEEMARDDFKAAYPDATDAPLTSDHKIAAGRSWTTADTVTVAEYFWIEYEEYEIGQVVMPDGSVQVGKGPFPKWADVRKRRKVKEPRVMWAKVTANEVLEGPTEMPCRDIPVIAVTGEEWHIGEETYRSSVVRFAKDPQMLYNYARSTQAEVVSMQPKAPYLVTTKQVAGLESYWANANTSKLAFLPYNPDERAPPPMRLPPPVSSSALLDEAQISAEDIKRTTGIHDASLGARSNETSGVAINARQAEAEASTSVYTDNMVKGIMQTGKIIVDMIPRVYDTFRTVRILGEDGQEKLETINGLMQSQDGIVPVNDMKQGKYDVRVQVGPAYDTRREASAAGMFEFLKVMPAAAPMIADLVAKMQDWPESDRVAERLRKSLPPGVAEDQDEEQSPEQMQQMQAAAQQQQQAMQMQQEAAQIELRKANAEALEAEANAVKAQADAQKAQIEAAMMMPPQPGYM